MNNPRKRKRYKQICPDENCDFQQIVSYTRQILTNADSLLCQLIAKYKALEEKIKDK